MNNQIYFKSSEKMTELADNSVDLIITSPPYFTIRDYSKLAGMQEMPSSDDKTIFKKKSLQVLNLVRKENDVGNIHDYHNYQNAITQIWKECSRVLKPQGKLCIVVPFYNSVDNLSYSLSFDMHRNIIDHTPLLYYDKFI
jgi:site-specific DNA-methyltransferase (cytosine-N4-specific)